MIGRVAISLLLFAQVACSWRPEDPRQVAERLAGPAVTTDVIEVEPGSLLYNGKRLSIGSDVSLWTEVLGDNVRIAYAGKVPRLHFWDDLGIRARFDRLGHPGARTIDIYLIMPDYFRGSPSEMDGYAPRSTYRGKLYVEGVRVGGDVSVRDLRAALSEDWNIGCIRAIGSCKLYERRTYGSSGIALMLGDQLESGPLDSVQVALPRERRATLIQPA